MKQLRLFCLLLLHSMVMPLLLAQDKPDYPTEGLLHHFTLDGNLKDRITGARLQAILPDEWKDRTPEFEQTEDGKPYALKTFPLMLKGNYSPERYPQMSIVFRFRQDVEYDAKLNFYFFQSGEINNYGFNWSCKQQHYVGLNTDSHPYIATEDIRRRVEVDGESKKKKWVTELEGETAYLAIHEPGTWQTYVLTVDTRDSIATLSSGGEIVRLKHYYAANTDSPCTGMAFFAYTTNGRRDYTFPEGAIDDILVYNRALSEAELCALHGVEQLEQRNGTLSFWENVYDSRVMLFVLLICPVLSLIFCVFRPKPLPSVVMENPNPTAADRMAKVEDEYDLRALNLGYQALSRMLLHDPPKDKLTSLTDPQLVDLIACTEVAPERFSFFQAYAIRRKLRQAQRLLRKSDGVRFFIGELIYTYNRAMRITFTGNIAILLVPFLMFFLPAFLSPEETAVSDALARAWDNIGGILFMMFMYVGCCLAPACTYRSDSEDENTDIRESFERLRVAYATPDAPLPPRRKNFMAFEFLNQGIMASIGSIFFIGSLIVGIIYTIFYLIFVVPVTIVSVGGKLFLCRDTLFPVIIIAIIIAMVSSTQVVSSIIGILLMVALVAYIIACWIAFVKNVIIRTFFS